MSYMDVHKMEVEMVMQGCLAEESDCDEEDCEAKATRLGAVGLQSNQAC